MNSAPSESSSCEPSASVAGVSAEHDERRPCPDPAASERALIGAGGSVVHLFAIWVVTGAVGVQRCVVSTRRRLRPRQSIGCRSRRQRQPCAERWVPRGVDSSGRRSMPRRCLQRDQQSRRTPTAGVNQSTTATQTRAVRRLVTRRGADDDSAITPEEFDGTATVNRSAAAPDNDDPRSPPRTRLVVGSRSRERDRRNRSRARSELQAGRCRCSPNRSLSGMFSMPH